MTGYSSTQTVESVLRRHLPNLDEDQLSALLDDLSEAGPRLHELLDEDDIARRLGISVPVARTVRSVLKDDFPKPLVRRALWHKDEIDAYFDSHPEGVMTHYNSVRAGTRRKKTT